MNNSSFFDEQKEQSLVKARIVEKYFWAWAKVIIGVLKRQEQQQRLSKKLKLAYIDLFAGPGRYQDGSESTPLRVLETAIQETDFRERLITLFNDVDTNNTQSLQNNINLIPNINQLKIQPAIRNKEVGEEIVKSFEDFKLYPTLFFVDPWGYKGLSLRLINSVVKNWGCDCIFFFNYNRINMGLGNDAVKSHMDALFGEDRAKQLRQKLQPMTSKDREIAIVEEICEALKEMGGEYVLPFRFRHENGNRTSHHLIFVSKHVKGYEIMKEIMAKESSTTEQGVPSFEYNPATKFQPLLFELSRPLDELTDMLLDEFAGQTMTMIEVYQRHHIGKRYIKKNYKDALLKLEVQGKIRAEPSKRKKNTFADKVNVTFPPKP
ncbi:MAG: three-Cys-motif partner protein TcmP [Coleofasciculus chthonoplastes F3-SA18-01]|uniref:three-Cys-motif partner protein TcmP n=1 Tax=Coleofasciculus chthonoplastes TaxID=64178 RepID=UPI0032F7120D